MSMSQTNILDELKFRYQTGGILTQLIMINVAVYLVLNIIKVGFILMASGANQDELSQFEKILSYLELTSDPKLLIKHFWVLITHMFTHVEFFHILFNMFLLYWFGSLFKNFIGESKILPVYFMGGLMGVLFFIAAYNFFPYFNNSIGSAIGASAAVMAIVFATATMIPNYEMRFILIGSIQLKWVALIVILLDIISIPKGNAGGHIAHLGGAFYGYLFATSFKNGNDWTKPFYTVWDGIRNFFDFSSSAKKSRKSKVKMAYKNEEKIKQSQTTTTNKKAAYTSKDKQEKIDDILDKIGKSGYPSLTEEEKAFLFQYSRED